MSSMKKTKVVEDVDPSIYLYDEVYDDMKQETSVFGRDKRSKGLRQEGASGEPEAPKFLPGLLKNAEFRKKDKERRKFRRYAREREDENPEEFKDKEVFVTASYKERLKYIEQIEREDGRQESADILHHQSNDIVANSSEGPSHKNHDCKEDYDDDDETDRRRYDEPQSDEHIGLPIKEPVDREKILKEKLAKRTVGKVFDEALARYMERKNGILTS